VVTMLGIDAVEVGRMRAIVERRGDRFLDRVFTPGEREYAARGRGDRTYERLAVRFAAKEAVCKAVGRRLPFRSVDVGHASPGGAPMVRCEQIAGTISVSLTHTRGLAVAVVWVEPE